MAKRVSDVERITQFFQTADEGAATVMFQVIKGIVGDRFAKEKPAKKARGPAKPKAGAKASNNGNDIESLRKLIRVQFFKEDIERFVDGKKLEVMDMAELTALRDTLAALPAEETR